MINCHSTKLSIVTPSLASYRLDYYDLIAEYLGTSCLTSLYYYNSVASDHAWTGLLEKAKFLKCSHFKSESKGFSGKIKSLFQLWSGFKSDAPGVIIICEYNLYSMVGIVWGFMHKIPVLVHTEIGSITDFSQFQIGVRWRHWFLGYFVSGQLASSPAARFPCNKNIKQVCFVPHAVRVGPLINRSIAGKDYFTFLFVGNLIPRKGIDYLCKAVSEVASSGLKFKVRLVGGGDHSWCEQLISKASLAQYIEIVGFREGSELIYEYSTADAFILLSRFDTFGAVAHEAASFGLPLILSKYAGCSEVLLRDGVNGYVVEPSDTSIVAQVMIRMISDVPLTRQMSLASHGIAEEFSVEASAKKTAELIRGLTAKAYKL